MDKFIIVSCLMILPLGWTINRSNSCSCNDFHVFIDCYSHYCNWNSTSSSCSQYNCSSLTNTTCVGAGIDCYLDSNSCLDRPKPSNCSSLSSKAECISALLCQWTSEDSCSDWSCENYNSQNCPGHKYGCVVSGTQCMTITSCSQFETCPEDNRCYTSGNNCVQSTCSSLGKEQCAYVLENDSFNKQWYRSLGSITPCYWSQSKETCNNATVSDLDMEVLCTQNTWFQYHWSSKSSEVGSCVACYGVLFEILFSLILLLE